MQRKLIDFAKRWAAPPGFVDIGLDVQFKILSRPTPAERAQMQRNDALRNRYRGRRCFVIGNGPSLARQDLTPLGDEVTIVMNHFHRHPILDVWQPTIYCASDPGSTYNSPGAVASLNAAGERIRPGAYIFPMSAKRVVDTLPAFPPETTHFVKTIWTLGAWPAGVPVFDLTRTMPRVMSTAHLAVQVAVFMGCNPIYLIGLDHDWLAHRSIDRHFYTPIAGSGGESDLAAVPYKSHIVDALNCWTHHERLRDEARKIGVRIANASAGGFLDVFPFADYESLVGTKSVSAN